MKLKSLSIFEFDKFANSHPLGSYHQSSYYALLAAEQGYDYDLIGLVDEDNNIMAASLILIKKIGLFNRYGYAPKGFLIDYYNPSIVKEFSEKLTKHYYKKNVAFIKINPEISIGTIDYKEKRIIYNRNQIIENTLKELEYRKLEGNKRFETKLPEYNAILSLKDSSFMKYSKNTRNKINKSKKNGMILKKAEREDIEIIYNFIKGKKNHNINHYYNYYNAFSKNDSIDLFLVEVNFEECLINLREQFEKEQRKNNTITEEVMVNPSKENLKKKMVSDNILNNYNESIAQVTNYLSTTKTKYIAGAITIRYKNRVYIVITGYDVQFKKLCPNYYLHYSLIEYYKNDFDFMDLNGITADFTIENPYKGLDEFKLGFNPITVQYIGEYDLIINPGLYKSLEQSGQLAKEFSKNTKKSVE